jgi:hypothetical protein
MDLRRRLLVKRQQPAIVMPDVDAADEGVVGRLTNSLRDHLIDQHAAVLRELDNSRVKDLE